MAEAGRDATKRERRRRRLRRRKLVRRWVSGILGATLAVGAGGLFVLLQTAPGQRYALDQALGFVRGSLAGELTVGEIRSRTLLAGATLSDLALTDARGRRVLSADSLVVRYLPTGLFGGAPRLRSVVFWGLDFEISTLAEGDGLNLERILAPPDPAADTVPTRFDLRFGQVGVREGRVSVLSPAAAPDSPGRVPGPLGPLVRLGLDGLDLDLEDAVLRVSEEVSFESDLASLTMEVSLPAAGEPLRVREAFGRLAFDLEDGLRIDEGAFRLPETLVRGILALGPRTDQEGWGLELDVRVDDWGALADLRWADPRIPDGTFRGGARVTVGETLDLDLDRVDLRLEASNLSVDGLVSFGARPSTRNLDVTVSPLALSRLEPWLERELPLDGWLSGRATFSGPLTDLSATGRVTLVPQGFGGHPTTADFSGLMHFGDDPGWTGLEARLDPLDYTLVQLLAPDVPITGEGSANVEIEGRLRRGLRLVAELVHRGPEIPESRAFVRGTLDRDGEGWAVDLSGDVAPLALAALEPVVPDLGLRGEVRGALSARGPLDALALAGTLEGDGGRLGFDATLDLLDPGSGYRLALDAERLPVARFSARTPERTEWNGRVLVEGAGLTLDSLEGRASVRLLGTRIAGLAIDTVTTELRAVDGVLHADTLRGSVAGIHVEGQGRLGLRSDREGRAELAFSAATLEGLRPLLMGDSLVVRDELTPLDLEFLRMEGVDPDTLPTAEEVRVTGAVDGVAVLSGRLDDLGLDLRMALVRGAYGTNEVDSLAVTLGVSGLPSTRGTWEADGEAFGVVWDDRSFDRASLRGTMVDREGDGTVQIDRSAAEAYELTGGFALDSVGGSARLRDARARLQDQIWRLARPADLSWTGGSLSVMGLEVEREGADPMHLTAEGTLSNTDDSDFRVDVVGMHLERIGAMGRDVPLDVSGHTDLSLHVRGPADRPLIDAEVTIEDPRFRNMQLTRATGTVTYRDRESTVSFEAWDGPRRALVASGTIPYDLSLAQVAERRVEAPMDLTLTADSLDAGLALAYFATLEDVEGVVTADVRIGGTTDDPVPSGSARLDDGAWTIDALGVRHRGVSGTLTLSPDQTMRVDLATTGAGTSTVTGSIGLSPLTDPSLDLEVAFDRFRAMNRRDIEGIASGLLTVGGSYQRPLVEGTLTVDQGTLQVDEFSRAAGVVDLTDPRLFGQGLAVDTTVFMSQPILADVRNPFLDNLRLNVTLAVPRDTWLRSNDMDVEMGGTLLVRYDRSANDLVLIGELEALRGTYRVLGRTFEVNEGTVAFIGRPGVNPSLNITADSRIRTREAQTVVITATVEGTLVQPRVTLTSESGDLSQSDLISYLVFNQSAAEIGRSQQNFLTGQFNNGAISTAVAGVVTFGLGSLVNQNASAIAQNLGFDYLSVQGGDAASFRQTLLEVGRYLSDDLFLVLVLRPLVEQEGSRRVGGVRVEWAVTNSYNLEAFVEDRFLRSGSGLFGVQDLDGEQLYGVLLFREWGYN